MENREVHKEILIEYFEDRQLKILDNDVPARGDDSDKSNYYVAVSLEYIKEYVLDNSISEAETLDLLFECCREGHIFIGACADLQNVVFYSSYYDWFHRYRKFPLPVDSWIYSEKQLETVKFINQFINDTGQTPIASTELVTETL